MDYNFKPGEVVVTGWNSKRQGAWSLKSEYGVKVVHIPTGIIVTCEKEKSQHRNRHLAFIELQIKIKASNE